jgi:hypothetical protein
MSAALVVLGELRARGARIERHGDRLRIVSARGVVRDLLAAIRDHKAELLQLVQDRCGGDANPPSEPAPLAAGGSVSWRTADRVWPATVLERDGDFARIEVAALGLVVTAHVSTLNPDRDQGSRIRWAGPLGCIDCRADLGANIVAGICFPCRRRRNPDAVPVALEAADTDEAAPAAAGGRGQPAFRVVVDSFTPVAGLIVLRQGVSVPDPERTARAELRRLETLAEALASLDPSDHRSAARLRDRIDDAVADLVQLGVIARVVAEPSAVPDALAPPRICYSVARPVVRCGSR